jgi:ABC-type branched-subunit amino acid transport system permease subunit
MDFTHNDDVLNTYRYLRLAMALLVGLLGVAVLWQVFSSSPHCLQRSISAYYYTPARAVFVAALCAIGTCLIVYKGNSNIEDVLLNFCGVTAFVVAFVPTRIDDTCKAVNVPTPDELSAAVTNNVWALVVIGVASVILSRIINPTGFHFGSWSKAALFWLALTTGVLAAGSVFFLAARTTFRDNGHYAAAISLFAGIVIVVLTNAYSYGRHNAPGNGARKYVNRYAYIAIAMVLTLVVIVSAHFIDESFTHWLFWLEAAIIVEFAIYWVIQTEELWNVVNRAQLQPKASVRPAGGAIV